MKKNIILWVEVSAVVSTLLFLIGTWIFFDMGETAFILYAAVYLALGIAAMLISILIRKKTQK